jgi:hypothetical protein
MQASTGIRNTHVGATVKDSRKTPRHKIRRTGLEKAYKYFKITFRKMHFVP